MELKDVLRNYSGRWIRKMDKSKGFYDWVWAKDDDLTTEVRPWRIERIYDGEDVTLELEKRLNLWKHSWVGDPEHGIEYESETGGHLSRRWPDGRDYLVADLIAMTLRDTRMKEMLKTPQPEMDKAGHVAAIVEALSKTNEEIQARASSGVGEAV